MYILPAGLVMIFITMIPQLYQLYMAFTDYRVKNLRFNQSILEAFSRAEMLGSELKLVKSDWGSSATCVPAAKLHEFHFTGTTEF